MWFCGQTHVPWHTLRLMGWDPVRAPSDSTHIVRSTSVVVAAQYTAHGAAYSTFDANATEVLRLASALVAKSASLVVKVNGTVLPRKSERDSEALRETERDSVGVGLFDDGWSIDVSTGVMTIAHSLGTMVELSS